MAFSAFTVGEKLTAAKLNERLASWIKFDGTGTVSVYDSYNVTTVNDIATGQYSFTLTTAFETLTST